MKLSKVFFVLLSFLLFFPVVEVSADSLSDDYELEINEDENGASFELKTPEFTVEYSELEKEMTLTASNGKKIVGKINTAKNIVEVVTNEFFTDFSELESMQFTDGYSNGKKSLGDRAKELGIPIMNITFNLSMFGYNMAGDFIESHPMFRNTPVGELFSLVVTSYWEYVHLQKLDNFATEIKEAIERGEVIKVDTSSVYAAALTAGGRGLSMVHSLQLQVNKMLENAKESYYATVRRLAEERTAKMKQLEEMFAEQEKYTLNYQSAYHTLEWAIEYNNVIMIKQAREKINLVEDDELRTELEVKWNEHFSDELIERLEAKNSMEYKQAVSTLNSAKKHQTAAYVELAYNRIMNVSYEPLRNELLEEWNALYNEIEEKIAYEEAKETFAYKNARSKLNFAIKYGFQVSINNAYNAILNVEYEPLRNELMEEWEYHFGNE